MDLRPVEKQRDDPPHQLLRGRDPPDPEHPGEILTRSRNTLGRDDLHLVEAVPTLPGNAD